MADVSESENGCSNKEKEKVAINSDRNDVSSFVPDSSIASFSTWSSGSDISGDISPYSDPFEGIFYRTYTSESKISISFVSSVFFNHSR